LPSYAFTGLEIYRNAFATGVPPGTDQGSSQRSPDLLAGLGGHFLADREGRIRKVREK